MAFLTVNTESVAKEGSSNYIQTSGIYDVTLRHCEVSNTKNGAVQVSYIFDRVMSYGNTILGTNGKPTFGYNILESLATVLGETELSDPEPTTVTFKTGTKELNCIPELNDVQVKAWIQFKYRMWNNEIREDVVVKRFYRDTDSASGSEVLSGEDIGSRYTKDLTVASEIVYEDGLTAEAVTAWKQSQQGTTDSTETPATKKSGFPGAAKKSGFPGAK